MDFQTAKLLTTVYELEGLLLVIDKHGADTPPQVVEALREKARKVGELAQLVELILFPGDPHHVVRVEQFFHIIQPCKNSRIFRHFEIPLSKDIFPSALRPAKPNLHLLY